MKKLANEEYKNMIVAVFENNGEYVVKASKNGKIIGIFTTMDMREAQEVYGNTVYEMYK